MFGALQVPRGGTIKDNTKPTLNPTASAEDPSQEIKRLRAEILEMRKELQATTDVPRWFGKWKDQQATTEETPMWFQKWKEEQEAKRKADSSKTVSIKIAISKLAMDVFSAISSGMELYKFLIVMTDD